MISFRTFKPSLTYPLRSALLIIDSKAASQKAFHPLSSLASCTSPYLMHFHVFPCSMHKPPCCSCDRHLASEPSPTSSTEPPQGRHPGVIVSSPGFAWSSVFVLFTWHSVTCCLVFVWHLFLFSVFLNLSHVHPQRKKPP